MNALGLACALALKIGAAACVAPPGHYVWEVEYVGHSPESYTTDTGQLEFTPVPYRVWRVRHNFNGGVMGEWSEWFPADRIAGDADGDCIVGAPDARAVGVNWARKCPF